MSKLSTVAELRTFDGIYRMKGKINFKSVKERREKRVWRKGKRTGADGKETMECELVDRWNSGEGKV